MKIAITRVGVNGGDIITVDCAKVVFTNKEDTIIFQVQGKINSDVIISVEITKQDLDMLLERGIGEKKEEENNGERSTPQASWEGRKRLNKSRKEK